MQASFSAFIEYQGKYTTAVKILEEITENLSKYEGKDNFSLKTSLEENDDNYRPTIWIRATGDPDPKSMEDKFVHQMDTHIREILENHHEGISGIYAKTVSVDPIDDDFFIPEITIVKYEASDDGKVKHHIQTYISDEVI